LLGKVLGKPIFIHLSITDPVAITPAPEVAFPVQAKGHDVVTANALGIGFHMNKVVEESSADQVKAKNAGLSRAHPKNASGAYQAAAQFPEFFRTGLVIDPKPAREGIKVNQAHAAG
jgi:hypothetical protein